MSLDGRELLRELANALHDSGPLELGVTPARWLGAVRAADRGLASADAGPSRTTDRRAKRSFRQLERFFSGKRERLSRAVALSVVALMIGIQILIVVVSHHKVRALLWTSGAIAALYVLGFAIERCEPNIKHAGTWLDLPDRQLFAHSVKASPSEVGSFVRAKLGMYIRPVLIATDRRLVLARPANGIPDRSNGNEFAFAWEILYRDITVFSSKTTGGENPTTLVSVQSRTREISYKFPGSHGEALVAILKRRAPEAFTESAASPPPARAAAATDSASQAVDSTAPRPRPPAWTWLCILPIGFGAWVPLLAGVRARRRAWQLSGGTCCLVILAGCALLPFAHRNNPAATISNLLLLAGWFMGCVATWDIRAESTRGDDRTRRTAHESPR